MIHKWAKEIKAFADGDEVECCFQDDDGYWSEWTKLEFIAMFGDSKCRFRVKPKLVLAYTEARIEGHGVNCYDTHIDELDFIKRGYHNIQLTFEHGSNKLIKAEVINDNGK